MARFVKRVRVLRLPVAALAVAAFVIAGCGGAATERFLTADGLARAAVTTGKTSTGRFTFGMEMTAPDGYETISFSGYGSFDTGAQKTAMSLDMSAFASLLGGLAGAADGDVPDFTNPELWKLEAVQDGLVMYMRFPLLSRVPGGLPKGKTWVRMDLRRVARMRGLDLVELQQLTSNDPRDALRCLEAVAGELEAIGEEEVHGAKTTHYHASIDLLRYKQLVPASQREKVGSMIDELVRQSGLRTIPVDVWVDEDSLVSKLTMTFSATQPGSGQRFDASIRFELYDYGEPVTIDVPSPEKAIDVFTLRT